jgi:hypothetical protein
MVKPFDKRTVPMKARSLIVIINIALLIITVVVLIRLFTKNVVPGFDFHCFWNGGNFIWQGTDPYQAFLDKKKVTLPVRYLDGVVVREGPIDPFTEQCVPGNTSPVVFLLAPLARFSWDTALTIWTTINLILAFAIGCLLLKILGHTATSREGILLLLLMVAQLSTRETLEYGQTSLLVTLFMFASMFFSYSNRTPSRAIISGVFLGFALSKPHLTFPLALLLIYRCRIIEVLTAGFIQLVGVWCVTFLGTSVQEVFAEYYRIFVMHIGPGTVDGMYLTAGLLKGLLPYSYIIVAAGSVVLGIVLLRWHIDRSGIREEEVGIDLTLLTITMLWNLLVFYHRRYDYVTAISFFALVIFILGDPRRVVKMPNSVRMVVNCLTGIIMVFWILPIYRIVGDSTYRYLFNICTMAALVISTWILFRLAPVKVQERCCQHVGATQSKDVHGNSSSKNLGTRI